MSDVRETNARVSICDETIDVKARLDCAEHAEALIDRIRYAAAFLWPQTTDVPEDEESDATAQAIPEPALQLSELERAKLTEKQASIIALRRQGRSYREIRDALGILDPTIAKAIKAAESKGVFVQRLK